MNANVEQVTVLQEDFFGPGQCADELNQIGDSLQRREELLVASARASRLLLEATDVRAAVPDVLRLIGEAARVDRVTLMLPQAAASREPVWAIEFEWVAEGVPLHTDTYKCSEHNYATVFAHLRAGHSVCLNPDSPTDQPST